jgi:murein L,D-transpeptidase YcbB/YkuD
MKTVRVVMLLAAVSVLSGCASMRGRQEMARLQSQVNLLDERITQLERSGVGASAALPLEPLPAEPMPAAAGTTFQEPRKSAKASGGASLKPTTREIQEALKNAGFYQGNVDGKTGPQTKEAIREVQRVHGLTDDGVVGKQTWAKLKAYSDLSGGSGDANAAETLK